MRSRIRRIRRSLQIAAAIGISLLVALPDAAFAAPQKSLDQMSQSELDGLVQQINETANWRKYRRPTDPPDFVPGKPVKVMHGAGASMGRGRGGGNFRRGGLASRRSSKSSGRNRDNAMAQDRGSRSSRNSSSSSSSRSSSGLGSSSRSNSNSNSNSNSSSSFGNSGSNFGNNGFGQ